MILNQFSLSNFELVTFCLIYVLSIFFDLRDSVCLPLSQTLKSVPFNKQTKQFNRFKYHPQNIFNLLSKIVYDQFLSNYSTSSVLNNVSFIRFPVKKIKVNKTSHKVFLIDLSLPVLPYFNINHIHVRL